MWILEHGVWRKRLRGQNWDIKLSRKGIRKNGVPSSICFFLLPLINIFLFAFWKGKWWKMSLPGYVMPVSIQSSRYVPHTKQVKLPHLICYAKNLPFFIHKNFTVHWTFCCYRCCKCIPLSLCKGSPTLLFNSPSAHELYYIHFLL